MLGERFKKARNILGLSQKELAEKVGLNAASISRVETGDLTHPNYVHVKYLVEQGINYFYLIEKSDEIQGQKINFVSQKEYENLKRNLEELENRHQDLQEKYICLERVLKLLKIEVAEDGIVRLKE